MAKRAWLLSGANEPFIHLYAASRKHENSDHGIVFDTQAKEYNLVEQNVRDQHEADRVFGFLDTSHQSVGVCKDFLEVTCPRCNM